VKEESLSLSAPFGGLLALTTLTCIIIRIDMAGALCYW